MHFLYLTSSSADEAPSAASERDVWSTGLRADRANRGAYNFVPCEINEKDHKALWFLLSVILNKLSGAAQLRVHHGRHGERHHLLRAGQEQEGGEEGGRHLCSGGIVQRAL